MQTSTRPKVISLINLKGGSGKTSAAVPLSYLAGLEASSVLLDLDPLPSARRWVELAEITSQNYAVYDLNLEQLSETVDAAGESGMQYVFIDAPGGFKDVSMSAALMSDLVIVPLHAGGGDVDKLSDTIKMLSIPKRHNPGLKVRVLLNHTGSMPAVTRRTRKALEDFGLEVLKSEIPVRSIYAEAAGNVPAGEHYPQVWKEILDVLGEMA